MSIHENRRRASSFGEDAEQYDRARPSYPAALVDDLLADGPRRVLDVGCGTGIAGRLFATRGCDVLGVEPAPRMAEVARSHGLQVEIGSFEKWNAGGDGGAGTIAHLEGTGRFTKPEVRTYLWEQRYSRDEWLDQLPTHSDHRTLPPEKLAAVLTAVADEIDAAGGSLVVHYDAMVVTALRLP